MTNKLKLFYWLPRIISILAILFISLLALDSFAPGYSVWQQLQAFLMHLIPTFILTIFLLIAWKWEITGGILFILTGAILSPVIFMHNYHMNHSIAMSLGILLMSTFPFIVVGILFILSQKLKKKNPENGIGS